MILYILLLLVDYCLVPHEDLTKYSKFEVFRMTNLLDQLNIFIERPPDHSIITWCCDFGNLSAGTEQHQPYNDVHDGEETKRYDVSDMPMGFMCGKNIQQSIFKKITELENLEQNQISIDEVYDGFCKVLIAEMSDKLPHKIVKVQVRETNLTRKRRKHNHPWWSERLSQLWTQMCDSESSWLDSNGARRPVLKSAYVQARKMFDRERQRCKREF